MRYSVIQVVLRSPSVLYVSVSSRSSDRVVDDAVIGIGVDDRRRRRCHSAELSLVKSASVEPELGHGFEILDLGVESDGLVGVQVVHPVHIDVEMVFLPLVDRDGKPVGLLPVQGARSIRSLEVIRAPGA